MVAASSSEPESLGGPASPIEPLVPLELVRVDPLLEPLAPPDPLLGLPLPLPPLLEPLPLEAPPLLAPPLLLPPVPLDVLSLELFAAPGPPSWPLPPRCAPFSPQLQTHATTSARIARPILG